MAVDTVHSETMTLLLLIHDLSLIRLCGGGGGGGGSVWSWLSVLSRLATLALEEAWRAGCFALIACAPLSVST